MDLVINDLKKLSTKTQTDITRMERTALNKIKNDTLITVKQSDKGGNIVVMDRPLCATLCQEILKDRTCYEILGSDPTDVYLGELKLILTSARTLNLVDDHEYDFLLPQFPKIATFYALPKVHKGLTPLKGRPIESGVGSITQNIGIYIDCILSPFVEALPSYIRDTIDLLKRLDGIVTDETALITSIDVEALYSSIPHKWGLKAVE